MKRNKHTSDQGKRAMPSDKSQDHDVCSSPQPKNGEIITLTEEMYAKYNDINSITIGSVTFNLQFTAPMPPLPFAKFKSIFNDIMENGIIIPIIIDEHGNVLDGKHRLIAAHILGIKDLPTKVRPSLAESDKSEFAQTLNVLRRQFTDEQLRELMLKQRHENKSLRQIAETLGVSHETVRQVLNEATVNNLTVEMPETTIGKDGKQRQSKGPGTFAKSVAEVKDALDAYAAAGPENIPNKPIDLDRLKAIARQAQTNKLRQQPVEDVKTGTATLLVGDFKERAKDIADESVDIIFTDPLYKKNALPIWSDLGILALRVLKPGGMLLSYSGNIYLPQIYEMLGRHLQYVWTLGILHTGPTSIVHTANVQQTWKPILWYAKPPFNKYWTAFKDMYSGAKEKEHHDFQQSVEEAKYYLKALCPSGGTVLDPMMGSGTSIIAAMQLGFNATGIEIDPAAYATAQERIKQVEDIKEELNV